MEKLIELLNEYTQTNYKELWIMEWCVWINAYDEDWVYFKELTKGEYTMEVEEVISKKIWFIKWLVENEKIEWDEKFYLEDDDWLFGTYECLLMLLAIQDNPIEFLISILK